MTILRLPQVKAKTGLGQTTIYEQQAEGVFPPNISLGARAVGWIEAEIDAVIAARAAGADLESIKTLIARLVAARNLGRSQ